MMNDGKGASALFFSRGSTTNFSLTIWFYEIDRLEVLSLSIGCACGRVKVIRLRIVKPIPFI